MKLIKKIILGIFTITLVLAFSSCVNNFLGGDEGTITINFGGRSGLPWPPDNPDNYILDKIEFEITLTSNNRTITFEAKGGTNIRRNVPVGFYIVKIDAYLKGVVTPLSPRGERIPYATGESSVDVKAGRNNPVRVDMYMIESGDPGKPDDPVYSITMESDGNGTAFANPSSASQGTTVTISATPNNRYGFKNWVVVSGNVTLSDTAENHATFSMPAHDVTIKANFEPLPANVPRLTLSPVFITSQYGSMPPHTVTITNTGEAVALISSISIDNLSFTVTDIGTVAAESTATFTVQPNTILNAGIHTATITIIYNGGDLPAPITVTTSVNLTVNKADPDVSWPIDLFAYIGQTLSDVTLPNNPSGTFTWTSPTTTSVGAVGNQHHNVTFTPADGNNFNTINKDVAVAVIDAFVVSNIDEWNNVKNIISTGGNNQNYTIIVIGNFIVPSNAFATFGNVTELNVTIYGSGTPQPTITLNGNSGNLIRIGANQSVVINNLSLVGFSGAASGPVVYLNGNASSFIMKGNSSVSGNRSALQTQAAGVHVDSGATFKMEDNSSVYGNTSTYNGGGVSINGGTFTMHDNSSVHGNTVNIVNGDSYGGGVYINNGSLNMISGTITGNTAYSSGGGVYVNSGSFYRSETANVSGNSAPPVGKEVGYAVGAEGPGGGIIFYVAPNGFTMTDDDSTAYYLEAAPVGWHVSNPIGDPSLAWATTGNTADVGTSGQNIGTGRNNTNIITSALNSSQAPAAWACISYNGNGLNDWFFPSILELGALQTLRIEAGINTTSTYSSSTENGGTGENVRVWDFTAGNQGNNTKGIFRVRPIRAF